MWAIETTQLCKTYDPPSGWRKLARTTPVSAVQDINLQIPEGQLFGLLGPNGAGKTTLVKMLCTLILPSSGTATIAGLPLQKSGQIRARIGLVVTDERSFYWRLSAWRNLQFFAAMYGLTGVQANERITQVLHDVDLYDVRSRRFSDFSSGMKQRLAIARSILHQPRILFLDEPSRSLDPNATQRLHALILRLRAERQMTMFLVTHDLVEAEALCEQVALMRQGQVQAVGRPFDLRARLSPQRHYYLRSSPVAEELVTMLQTIAPSLTYADGELRFWAGETDGVLTAVLAHLHQHNITIQTIESAPPSLEQVFRHYTEEPS